MNFVIYYYFFSLYVFNAVQPNRVFSEIKVFYRHLYEVFHMTPVALPQHRAGAGPNKSLVISSWNWHSININCTFPSDIKTCDLVRRALAPCCLLRLVIKVKYINLLYLTECKGSKPGILIPDITTFCSYNIFEKVIFVKRTLNIFET